MTIRILEVLFMKYLCKTCQEHARGKYNTFCVKVSGEWRGAGGGGVSRWFNEFLKCIPFECFHFHGLSEMMR